MTRRRLLAAILVAALFSSALLGQSSRSQTATEDQSEIPELAGAQRAEGSQLVDGELPRPFVDYSVSMDGAEKKLSLFQSGLVVLTDETAGVTTRKRVTIPPDAVEAYRKVLTTKRLADVPKGIVIVTPTTMRETIRIWDQDGSYVERTIDPSMAVTTDLGRIRFLIQDLFRVIDEDREITNPMADYVPKAGDILIGEDLSMWKIERVDESNGFIVILSTAAPVTMYVPLKDLDTRFFGHRTPPDAE